MEQVVEENVAVSTDYTVFIPRGGNEFVIGYDPTMEEMGLGLPYEIEVFYGTLDQCVNFVKESPFDRFLAIESFGEKPHASIVTLRYYIENELFRTVKIVGKGDYIQCHEKCVDVNYRLAKNKLR